MKTHYRTIILSDLHLGIRNSRVKEVVTFLREHKCDTLILNGDIVDGWQLRKSGEWKKKHTQFFRILMKYLYRYNTKVIYLRGNHDDFLDEILPFSFGPFVIKRTHILQSGAKKYFVVHGDIFDTVTTQLKWLAKLGDVGYTFLLWLNRHYNQYRVRRGLPYYSLSQVVKAKVKSAVSFISDYEEQLCEVAKAHHCDGVICGHIHQAADKMIGPIHYLNSGDWVETMSALVETHDGEWRILYYTDWQEQQQPDTPAPAPVREAEPEPAYFPGFAPDYQTAL
ncbi:MAG TPA: UDP-2,3-diacylglucosamine diphosphatase [Lacibacter sp.]|nr:UDP-2,3-diacylglucosamine diphosphatase [Lacibacter sp.]HMO88521.1 UDP-2,3-diacylglucosamine diphosphatase [Lacibacter sp.]